MNARQENQPERTRVWTAEQSIDVVLLQVRILPPLKDTLTVLAAGKLGLIKPIVEKVADELSYNPDINMDPATFRRLSGAPVDDAQLESWRKNLYDQYQAAHKLPKRPA
jgi:hypothetical protein